MDPSTLQQRLGISLGLAVLCGGSLLLGYRARAQTPATTPVPVLGAPTTPEAAPPAYLPGAMPTAPAQFAAPPTPEPGFGGGGRPFGGFPGGGGFGGGYPATAAGRGGTELVGAGSNVVMLRGNHLYSFDAKSLKMNASVEVPGPPEGSPVVRGRRGGGAYNNFGGSPAPGAVPPAPAAPGFGGRLGRPARPVAPSPAPESGVTSPAPETDAPLGGEFGR